MDNQNEKAFRPKAHILRLLGEELIKSPTMAIYELIKNSYDADASYCKVNFSEIESIDHGKITVIDNGLGMTEKVLKDVWLEPGTDFRKKIDENGERQITRSVIYNRVPTGEKGVGRFASHRLGRKISLITRPTKVTEISNGQFKVDLLNYELHLSIDWSVFSQGKYLDSIPIKWKKITSENDFYFKNESGTKIEIEKIQEPWTRGMARTLKRSTLTMLSPKSRNSNFEIELDFQHEWISDFPNPDELLEVAPYKMNALVDEEFNFTFEYSFSPAVNSNLRNRAMSIGNREKVNIRGGIRAWYREHLEDKELDGKSIEEELKKFDISKIAFGPLMVEMYSYDLDSKSLRDSFYNPQTLKDFVKGNAGVRVFKDDLRVFNYGEPGNDWLGLSLKRVNKKEWFSNNQSIGYIYLDAEASNGLVEKTNREGFIQNENFDLLVIIIMYILTQFKEERYTDSEYWRDYYNKQKTRTVSDSVSLLYKAIDQVEFKSISDKKKIISSAKKIEKSFKEKEENLILPAGVGLTASVALHEIEKLVPRIFDSVKEKPIDREILVGQVEELKQYTDGILSILRAGGAKLINIKESIDIAVRNYDLKLRKRKIDVVTNVDEELVMKCDRRYLVTMLLNIFDNSIYWLDTIYKVDKKIVVSVTEYKDYISLLVANNGPVFADSPQILVQPYRSRKDGGTGIGLYIIDTVMIQYGKLNLETDLSNIEADHAVPFEKGAFVELQFKLKNVGK
jgi:hypothetical protein